jgi:hypothetical protein
VSFDEDSRPGPEHHNFNMFQKVDISTAVDGLREGSVELSEISARAVESEALVVYGLLTIDGNGDDVMDMGE